MPNFTTLLPHMNVGGHHHHNDHHHRTLKYYIKKLTKSKDDYLKLKSLHDWDAAGTSVNRRENQKEWMQFLAALESPQCRIERIRIEKEFFDRLNDEQRISLLQAMGRCPRLQKIRFFHGIFPNTSPSYTPSSAKESSDCSYPHWELPMTTITRTLEKQIYKQQHQEQLQEINFEKVQFLNSSDTESTNTTSTTDDDNDNIEYTQFCEAISKLPELKKFELWQTKLPVLLGEQDQEQQEQLQPEEVVEQTQVELVLSLDDDDEDEEDVQVVVEHNEDDTAAITRDQYRRQQQRRRRQRQSIDKNAVNLLLQSLAKIQAVETIRLSLPLQSAASQQQLTTLAAATQLSNCTVTVQSINQLFNTRNKNNNQSVMTSNSKNLQCLMLENMHLPLETVTYLSKLLVQLSLSSSNDMERLDGDQNKQEVENEGDHFMSSCIDHDHDQAKHVQQTAARPVNQCYDEEKKEAETVSQIPVSVLPIAPTLTTAQPITQLKQLYLNNCNLSPQCGTALSAMLRYNTSLEVLELKNNHRFTNHTYMELFHALYYNTTLIDLNLALETSATVSVLSCDIMNDATYECVLGMLKVNITLRTLGLPVAGPPPKKWRNKIRATLKQREKDRNDVNKVFESLQKQMQLTQKESLLLLLRQQRVQQQGKNRRDGLQQVHWERNHNDVPPQVQLQRQHNENEVEVVVQEGQLQRQPRIQVQERDHNCDENQEQTTQQEEERAQQERHDPMVDMEEEQDESFDNNVPSQSSLSREDLDSAIEAGDWAAVSATAALLTVASSSNSAGSRMSERKSAGTSLSSIDDAGQGDKNKKDHDESKAEIDVPSDYVVDAYELMLLQQQQQEQQQHQLLGHLHAIDEESSTSDEEDKHVDDNHNKERRVELDLEETESEESNFDDMDDAEYYENYNHNKLTHTTQGDKLYKSSVKSSSSLGPASYLRSPPESIAEMPAWPTICTEDGRPLTSLFGEGSDDEGERIMMYTKNYISAIEELNTKYNSPTNLENDAESTNKKEGFDHDDCENNQSDKAIKLKDKDAFQTTYNDDGNDENSNDENKYYHDNSTTSMNDSNSRSAVGPLQSAMSTRNSKDALKESSSGNVVNRSNIEDSGNGQPKKKHVAFLNPIVESPNESEDEAFEDDGNSTGTASTTNSSESAGTTEKKMNNLLLRQILEQTNDNGIIKCKGADDDEQTAATACSSLSTSSNGDSPRSNKSGSFCVGKWQQSPPRGGTNSTTSVKHSFDNNHMSSKSIDNIRCYNTKQGGQRNFVSDLQTPDQSICAGTWSRDEDSDSDSSSSEQREVKQLISPSKSSSSILQVQTLVSEQEKMKSAEGIDSSIEVLSAQRDYLNRLLSKINTRIDHLENEKQHQQHKTSCTSASAIIDQTSY